MTLLTNRTYPMLREFATAASNYYMSIEQAQSFDQRPFRSMLIHRWISYRPGKGFRITPEGKDAWVEFGLTEIFRKDPRRPLTKYFEANEKDLSYYAKGA